MESLHKIFVMILGFMLLIQYIPSVSVAQSAEAQSKKAILLLIDRLGMEDLTGGDMPLTQEWVNKSALALMNSNTGGTKNDGNAYLTLAQGVPVTTKEVPEFYNVMEPTEEGETANNVYSKRMGQPASGAVLLNTSSFRRSLAHLAYPSEFGLLGNEWARHHLRTAVIGSLDEGKILKRYGGFFAVDAYGQARTGKLFDQDVYVADSSRPFGMRMDLSRVRHVLERLQTNTDLLVIDAGDLYRLDAYQKKLTGEQYNQLRKKILAETDRLIDLCMKQGDRKTLVMAVTPHVSLKDIAEARWLSPLLLRGGDMMCAGTLTSSTTRRYGIVSNLDIAPTLLHHFSIQAPPQMLGHPLEGVQGEGILEKMESVSRQTAKVYTWRPAVMLLYGGFALGIFLLSLWTVWRQWRNSIYLIEKMVIAVLSAPLVWLLLPLFPSSNGKEWLIYGGMILAAIYGVLSCFPSPSLRLACLCMATVAVILVDIGSGGYLAAHSILSYDPIVGARYYGIGNEYMGFLLGSVLLSLGCLLEEYPRFKGEILSVYTVFFVYLVYFFASPQLGTNAGGALTASVAFSLTLFFLWKKSWSTTGWLVLAGALTAAYLLLLLLNQPHLALESHISQAARSFWLQEEGEIQRIILRKLGMNLRIIHWHRLGIIFIILLCVFFAGLIRQTSFIQGIRNQWPFFYPAVVGVTGGSFAGLCLNDSGVVVAVMMMLPAAFLSCLFLLKAKKQT